MWVGICFFDFGKGFGFVYSSQKFFNIVFFDIGVCFSFGVFDVLLVDFKCIGCFLLIILVIFNGFQDFFVVFGFCLVVGLVNGGNVFVFDGGNIIIGKDIVGNVFEMIF